MSPAPIDVFDADDNDFVVDVFAEVVVGGVSRHQDETGHCDELDEKPLPRCLPPSHKPAAQIDIKIRLYRERRS